MPFARFNFPLAILLLGLVLGIGSQELFCGVGLAVSVGIAIGTLGALFLCFFKLKQFVQGATLLAGIGLGILSYQAHEVSHDPAHYLHQRSPAKEYSLQGTIIHIKGRTLIVSLQAPEGETYKGKVVLHLKDSLTEEALGQALLFHCKLSPIATAQSPYQFDYKRYMARQGVFWQGYPTTYILQRQTSFSPFITAQQLQGFLAHRLSLYPFSSETLGILKALVLGIRSDIAPELYQQYVDAGVVHILAISGLHVGIITYLLSLLLSWLVPKKKKSLKIALILSFLLAYAFITGLSASVVRSVVMFGSYSIAYEVGSRRAKYDSLLLSALVLLLCKPSFLFEVGFQLSYMAVLSILLFLPLIEKYTSQYAIVNFFGDILKVSLAAQIGVWPLSLYYFHQFSGLFWVSNLLLLPLLGVILSVGIVVVVLAGLQWLPMWLVSAYDGVLSLMNKAIGTIASVDAMVISDAYFDAISLILCYLAIVLAVIYLKVRYISLICCSLLIILGVEGYFFYQKYIHAKQEQLLVFQQYKKTVIGVQQGEEATFYLSDTTAIPHSLVRNFRIQHQIKHIHYKPLGNFIPFKGQYLSILDGPYYLDHSYPTDYLLLRNNPKIHLEKLLKQIRPKVIIADGSNWPFLVAKWQKTCQQLNVSIWQLDHLSISKFSSLTN